VPQRRRPKIPCIVPGCGRWIARREYCLQHYRAQVLPRCRIRGCQRPALRFGLCDPHWKNGGRPIKLTRPKRSTTGEARVLAWGRIHIVRSAVPVIEEEARRRSLTPSAMIADIVEAWAREKQEGRSALRLDETCRAPGCDRPARASGLCRTHRLQLERRQALTPIRPRQQEVRMGSLRLPEATVRALRKAAEASRVPLTEVLRQRLHAGLHDIAALANRPPTPAGRTVRLGALPMPAALAERLNVAAQELGLSASEVIRRALGGSEWRNSRQSPRGRSA
jgi:hypothetical protein